MTTYIHRLLRMDWGDSGHYKGPKVGIEYGAQGCGVTLGLLGLELFPLVPPLGPSPPERCCSSPGVCGPGSSWSFTWALWVVFGPSWAFLAPSFVSSFPASKLLCLCMDGADWLPCHVLRKLPQLTAPIGSCLFMSRHMVEATRAYLAVGGVRFLNEGVPVGDFSWNLLLEWLCTGCGSHAAQHSYSAGSTSRHLPRSEAIPAIYLFNIDVTTWFFAVILDGHAAGLAIVSMVLSPTTLLGRDPLLLERNILKNFAHADDARSKRKGRQLNLAR